MNFCCTAQKGPRQRGLLRHLLPVPVNVTVTVTCRCGCHTYIRWFRQAVGGDHVYCYLCTHPSALVQVMKRMTTRVAHVKVFFSPGLGHPTSTFKSELTLRLAGKETSAERPMDSLPVQNPEPIVQRC
jgi:hypothetical protein